MAEAYICQLVAKLGGRKCSQLGGPLTAKLACGGEMELAG
jgi:hypothetical protein